MPEQEAPPWPKEMDTSFDTGATWPCNALRRKIFSSLSHIEGERALHIEGMTCQEEVPQTEE